MRLPFRRRVVYIVHPDVHRVTKFLPSAPPERGDIVLVEGIEGLHRGRVVKDPKVEWSNEPEADGYHYRWWLREPLRVVADPA